MEPSPSRDTDKLDEVPEKFYIPSEDELLIPVVLGDMNFGKSYPIWIRNASQYPSISLEARNENGAEWRYHAPQELYRILLPPYEPVFLIEDTKRRGQFFPLFIYAFDYPFDEAAFISLPEITAGGILEVEINE